MPLAARRSQPVQNRPVANFRYGKHRPPARKRPVGKVAHVGAGKNPVDKVGYVKHVTVSKKSVANVAYEGHVNIDERASKFTQPAARRKMAFGAVAGSHFDVRGFCKRYALKRDLISRMTSYAPRTIADWVAGKPIRGAALLKITELRRLTNALEKLVEPESIGPWFQTPNQSFEGSTPAQLVERGESDRLWRMIHILESGQPG